MLDINSVSIAYGDNVVVGDVSMRLKDGQIGCLLGPSGCGKTTLLRAIAGFEPVVSGDIAIRDTLMSKAGLMTAVQERNVGLVFQDFALFPHLSVADNVAFGLKHLPNPQRKDRVNDVLQLVALSEYAQSFPHRLSGGQQQRVALARAIAPRPQLLLLDEPFSSLDTQLRLQLASDVRQILKKENMTALLVTHDQEEAFAFADTIGVMGQGRLHQWDDAHAIYHTPSTQHVANFIGESVWLPATLNNGVLQSALGDFSATDVVHSQSGNYELLVRPDDVVHDDSSQYIATITAKHFRGANILFELNYRPQGEEHVLTLLCLAPSHHNHNVGDKFGIRLDIQHAIAFVSQTA